MFKYKKMGGITEIGAEENTMSVNVDESESVVNCLIALYLLKQLPEDARVFLEQEAEETGVPLSNLVSYIAVNYVREERKKRSLE